MGLTYMHTYVIIPFYRPAEKGFLDLITQICDKGYIPVLINDASPDAALAPLGQPDPRMILLHHERHRGRGAAIRTGLAYIRDHLLPEDHPQESESEASAPRDTAYIAVMATSSRFSLDDLECLLETARLPENVRRLTVGVHHPDRKRSLLSRAWNGGVHLLFHALVHAHVPTDMTGLQVFSADFLPRLLELEGDHADYDLRLLRLFSKKGGGFSEVVLQGEAPPARKNRHIVLDTARLYQHLLRFTASSMFSFLLEYGLFCLLHYLLRDELPLVGDLIATVAARVFGNGVNYTINCLFVFRRKPNRSNILQFAGLTGASIGLSALALYLWKLTRLPVPVCKILADLCVFVVNYIVQKKLIFRKKKPSAGKKTSPDD